LGSILSWDDDEQANEAVNAQAAALSAALRDRDATPGTSAPPDMVQFSLKDGQFTFLQQNQNTNGGSQTPTTSQVADTNGNASKLTMQLPLPTPVAGLATQATGGEATSTEKASTTAKQQSVSGQQSSPSFPANFAQLLASGNMLQAGAGVTQQVPQVQLPYPAPFLQQLQYAQLQQQIQAQQAASSGSGQFSQRGNVPIVAAPPASRTKSGKSPPVAKKQKTTGPMKAVQEATSKMSAVPPGIVSSSDTDGDFSKKSLALPKDDLADTSHLSQEEKLKANRDRNREHARNTRLRKKAYLEKLQTTVDELCKERDNLVSERTGAANLLVEMHNTRTEVLMSFFALRSSNERRRRLWSSILDESCFACVMPVTPYRSFPSSEVQVSKCQRTIMGIDAIIADTASLHVLFQSLVDRSQFPLSKVDFRYTLVTEESVVAGNQMMARWILSTTNATQCGANMEVTKEGMLCCKFNSAHRITGFELMFDVMAFMLQLKQAAGSGSFSVVPNTVQTCQRGFNRPMMMTLSEPPYTIIQVNKLWESATGYSSEEVVGKKSMTILQQHERGTPASQLIMEEMRYKRSAAIAVAHRKKSGENIRNFLMIFPLSTDSRITHYLHLSNHIDDGEEPAEALIGPAAEPVSQPPLALRIPGTSSFPSQTIPPPVLFTGMPALSGAVSKGPNGRITLPQGMRPVGSNTVMPPPSTNENGQANSGN